MYLTRPFLFIILCLDARWTLLEVRRALRTLLIQWKRAFLLSSDDVPNDERLEIIRTRRNGDQIAFTRREVDVVHTSMGEAARESFFSLLYSRWE